MSIKFKRFVYALHSIVNNDDYLRYITNGEMSYRNIGSYMSPADGKSCMQQDLKNVTNDLKKSIKEAHGKIAAE